MRDVDVSIVIPAYNEEKYIENCLNSLKDQKTNLKYEVIVVDNNSQDATVKVAQSFKDQFKIRTIHESKQGRGAARARGFEEAKGWMILSTDADAIVYPDWIDTLVASLDGKMVATTTSCKTLDLGPLKNAIFNFFQPIATYVYRGFFGYFWLAGFSFAIKKDVYIKSGGFNPNLQALEDVDLAQRVAKFGKIKFIQKPVIFSGRRFKKGLFKGLFQYVYAHTMANIFKKRTAYLNNVR